MTVPKNLPYAIEQILHQVPKSELAKAAKALSIRYREGREGASCITKKPFLLTELDRLAYLAVRMKATYQAIVNVFLELSESSISPKSMLDLGAGSGAGIWAFNEVFGTPEMATLLEVDKEFVKLGQKLLEISENPALKNVSWVIQNICNVGELPPCDVVLLSYSLGELSSGEQQKILEHAWAASKKALVVIEPGTKRGYATVIEARQALIAMGRGHLFAPCPHEEACPMLGTRDWCHFKARLDRTSSHRQAKGALLGYEDENYSYVIFTTEPSIKAAQRVVGMPEHHAGHVALRLCESSDGIKKIIYSRKQGELYRKAKKVRLGDRF